MLKVAIVGNGNICNRAHIPAWRSVKDAEIVAVCDIMKERAERAAKEVNAKAYTSIDDLLSEEVDVIDLCVPTHLHAELAIKSLKAGKHVICEKPISNNLQDAKAMIKAAKENGKRLFIAHTRRFDPRFLRIKEAVDREKIGTPVYLQRSERSWLPFQDTWHWDPKKSGGVLLDVGIHCVDMARWFLDAEPIEVFAKGKTIREEAKRSGCYDFAVLLIKFKGEKRAIIEVSWAHPKEWAPFYSNLTIIGTQGKIEYSDKDSNPMVVVTEGKISFPRYSPLLSAPLEAFSGELSHFLKCITKGIEPRITPDDAYIALKVIKVAENSIKEGRPIEI